MAKRYIDQVTSEQYVKDLIIEMLLNNEEFFGNLMEFESYYNDSPWCLNGTKEKKLNDMQQIYNEYISEMYKCVGIKSKQLEKIRKCAGLKESKNEITI